MRISDWSSDVCSSDLEGECDFAQAQFEQPVAAPRLAIIIAFGRCPAQYLDLPGVEPEPLIYARDLGLGCALIRQEDARRAAFDDRGRDARSFDVRSEEHTSELQSLMRNSYDVFCLK